MPGEVDYWLAVMTGITGAFHCLGMCGTFAGGYFIGHGGKQKFLPQLSFHGVRIFTYVMLGVGGALTGRVLAQAGFVGKAQGVLMIAAGCMIIIAGLWLGGFLSLNKVKSCHKQCGAVHFQDWKQGKTLPLLAGLINGLVPCSLVFSVAVKTLVMESVAEAGMFMLLFGLGTLPMMLLVTTSGALVGEKIKGIFIPLAGISLVLMGSWTLYEGYVFYDIMRGLAN